MFLFASCSKNTEEYFQLDNKTTRGYDYNSLPKAVYITFDDLKEIKSAFDTMNSEEFATYMENEKFNHYLTGTWDFENSKALIEELFLTTVPLLDGNENNFPEIGFYWERNEVQQLVFFDENSRASVYSYTPKSGRTENSFFGANNENAVLLKELTCNGVSVFVYKTNNKESFFADVFADGTHIFMSTKHIDSINKIEECFTRLKFVKIGDLLDKSDKEKATQIISNTELSGEKVTEETEFVITETNTASDITTEIFTKDYSETIATQ